MIYSLKDMFMKGVSVNVSLNGRNHWSIGVSVPYTPGLLSRLKGAWAVITQKAFPVMWPEPGELEHVLFDQHSKIIAPSSPPLPKITHKLVGDQNE